MIVKHFHHNEWQLGEDWENTDYVFGIADSDAQIEQSEKALVALLEISDDEEDLEEGDEELSLPLHRYTQNEQASPWRVRRSCR
jgi:hypothetical protein